MAKVDARVPGRRTLPAALLSTLVATTTLVVVLFPSAARADQVSDLRAQATTVSQELIEEQLQVGADQQQVSVVSQRLAADAGQVAAVDHQVALDQQAISTRTDLVRRQAILAYINDGSKASGADAELFAGSEESAQAADEYTTIASGNIATALDQLHTAEQALQTQQAVLQQRLARDQADTDLRAAALSASEHTESQLQSVQSQVTGQLAIAVAQPAAAQQAAAAAAVSAAQRAAARSVPARSAAVAVVSRSATSPGPSSSPAPSAPPGGGSVADPALNPFLQCVVQAESGGDYGAVSPNGLYMGAFQFSQPTWDTAAQDAGLGFLVGVPPNEATKPEQDSVAVALYALDGDQPWLGDRCS